jgi:hypothetical protein
MKPVLRVLMCLALACAAALAQSVVAARSGLVHYLEGRVFVGNLQVESKFGNYPEVKENTVLHTEQGRAEVLLTPGVFLRVGENSSFRMITNRLIDTRLEVLSGHAVIEADDLLKDNAVTVVFKDAAVRLLKKGLYRFDSQPAALRVFDGAASVQSAGKTVEVKDGKMITLDGDMAVAKFNKDLTDALDRWSRRRGEYVAMANVSAANQVRRSGMSLTSSSWAWNPYFGMFTFIPMNGSYYSPYGYRFWSPSAVYRVYEPRVYYGGNNSGGGYNSGYGYSSMPQTSSGYSGTMASAPSSGSYSSAPTSSAAGAASSPVSHSAGSSGGSGATRR